MKIIGKKIIHYREIDSTNDEAKRLIDKGLSEGAVIVADSQTKGRGKPGSSWFSLSKAGIYLSVIVKPHKNPKDIASITILGARAVINVIQQVAGLKAEIKLPNDVILNGKKVCGVLTERLASGHIIIGIGLNVNHLENSFPDELKDLATSLKIETRKSFDLREARDKLIRELDKEYLAYLNKI
ncbi:MAG: biotin--[acetyl-CoA-carboxylase] ligase [Candidatus Margulisiibacteriota bacterium]